MESFEQKLQNLNDKLAANPFAIIPDLDIELYHDCDGISKSGLDKIHKSPATYKVWKETPREETKALRDGKRIHTCLLEPDKFSKIYIPKPDREKRSNVDKAWWAEFDKELKITGQVIATQEEIDTCFRMQDSLLKNPLIRRALMGAKEITAFAKDLETGLLVKARADVINPVGCLIDLKTTEDCSPEAFSRSIANYRYHVQNQFHIDVFNQALLKLGPMDISGHKVSKIRDPIILAVEKEEPWNFELYTMHLDDLQEGFNAYKEDLSSYKEAKDKNYWPTTGGDLKEIRLPKWAKRTEVEIE